jgi:NADH-quinone oxidoreductase subunit H
MKGRAASSAPILLAIALAGVLLGERSRNGAPVPLVVRVLDLAPDEVEVGDRIAIHGSGFPLGKPARVTFRGTMHRPGERPLRGSEVVVVASVLSSDRLELAFDDATQALFSGVGARAVHTTFEGDVEVAFPAAAPGVGPLSGVLEHVILDTRPGVGAALGEREREGKRVLDWMGLQVAQGGSGLVIDAVKAGSRAEAAGIAAGDIVTRFDGVRVSSAADALPPPGEHFAILGMRTPGAASETARSVSVEGLRPAPATELVAASVLVFAALALVGLFGAPTRPTVAAALQRVVSKLRERKGPVEGLSTLLRDVMPPRGPAALVVGAVYSLLALMSCGEIATHLDVGALFVAALSALGAGAFMTQRSAWSGALAAAHVAWQHVPAAVAIASAVVSTGSLRIREIAHAQGGCPWDWIAFRDPASLVALGLLLASCRIEVRAGAQAVAGPHRAEVPRGPWIDAARHAHLLLVGGLASAVFMGGWWLPGFRAAEQEARPTLVLAGAVWFLAKTWLVLVAVAWIRSICPIASTPERTRSTLLWLAPLALAMLVVSAVWTQWGPPPAGQRLVSACLFTLVVLTGAALSHRVRHGVVAAGAGAHLSPFL